MFWTMAITALCTAGIGFYLRFLVALCKECKMVSTGYWMLLRAHTDRKPVVSAQPHRKQVVRVA